MILMKKLLSFSLICLMVFQFAMLLGMEPAKSGKVLEGTISVMGKPFYSLDKRKRLDSVFGTTIEKGDPIVKVWVRDTTCKNWSNTPYEKFMKTHPKYQKYLKIRSKLSKDFEGNVNGPKDEEQDMFSEIYSARLVPNFFPVSWFRDKQGGGFLQKKAFLALCIFGVPVKIKFDGVRVKDPNNWCAPMVLFHGGLQKLQTDFEKTPRWEEGEEERLVKEEILVKNWLIKKWWTGNTHSHGPNSSIMKNRKN